MIGRTVVRVVLNLFITTTRTPYRRHFVFHVDVILGKMHELWQVTRLREVIGDE